MMREKDPEHSDEWRCDGGKNKDYHSHADPAASHDQSAQLSKGECLLRKAPEGQMSQGIWSKGRCFYKEGFELRNGIAVLLLLAAAAYGCATIDERVAITPAAGVEKIPTKIAVYPLLTSEAVQAVRQPRYTPMTTSAADDRMYIVAPAETKLASTIQSQLLTSLLSAQLSGKGFILKELPVEAPAEQPERDRNSFFVSLETLRHLRENYGVEAILLGNVYFVADERDPTVIWVRAAYLRLVDTGTLDVICHASIFDEYQEESMEDVARSLALALAKQAKLVSSGSK